MVEDKNELRAFARKFNINISAEAIASLSIPNSVPSMVTTAWMKYYFELVGDHAPDADAKILLEAIPKKAVYQEYRFDMECKKQTAVSLNLFLFLWKKVYSHVAVRKFKSSCGHCHVCTVLGEMRRKHRDAAGHTIYICK